MKATKPWPMQDSQVSREGVVFLRGRGGGARASLSPLWSGESLGQPDEMKCAGDCKSLEALHYCTTNQTSKRRNGP